eukprot:Sspe_Gene.70350::Locus_41535_Transcript_1_2_Confidence_0.800_Length_1450::g.70350::m.70350/K19882/NOTUM; O-palmitoleoyl-L-serine hydrolase
MKAVKAVYLAVALIVAGVGADPLKKITLDAFPNARCLDGSPYVMYFRPAPKGSVHHDQWVFDMRGGGACLTPEACHHRAKGPLGSSTGYGPTWSNEYGCLSSNKTINPFWDFNHVFLPYCTGDFHSGTNTERNVWGLYFSGHINVEATLHYLLQNSTLDTASKVLVTGESAGGIGTFVNADFVQQTLPHAKVMAMPVAGFYFPEGTHSFPEWLDPKLDIPYNLLFSELTTRFYSAYLNPHCTESYTGDKRECVDANVNYRYIKTPLLVVENMYDKQQINDELLCPKNCVDGYKEAYGKWMRATMLKEVLSDVRKENGLFMPSCFDHTGNLCPGHDVQVNGTTFREAAAQWYFDGNPPRLMDSCDGSLPCNTMCTVGTCADPSP